MAGNPLLDFIFRVSGEQTVSGALRRISLAARSTGGELRRMQRAAGGSFKDVDLAVSGVKTSLRGLASAPRAITGATTSSIGALTVATTAATRSISTVTGLAYSTGRKTVYALEAATRRAQQLASTTSRIALAGAAFGAVGAAGTAGLVRSLSLADINLQMVTSSLEVATGSAAGAAREIEYLRKTTYDLGVAFDDVAPTYSSFVNGFVVSGGSIEEARKLFLGLSLAVKGTGGSSEQLQRALVAVSQSFGKGTLQSEELRGQLGEALPGAVGLLAKSLGVSVAELGKMTEGGLEAQKAFAGFGDFLINKFSPAAQKASQGIAAAFARFQNETAVFKQDAGAGIRPALLAIVNDITAFIRRANEAGAGFRFGETLGNRLLRAYRFVRRVARDIVDVSRYIKDGFEGMARGIIREGEAIYGVGRGFLYLDTRLQELSGTLTLVDRAQGVFRVLQRTASRVFNILVIAARSARGAFLDFVYGAFGRGPLSVIVGTGNGIIDIIESMVLAFARLAGSRVFIKWGQDTAATVDFIKQKLQELTGAQSIGEFASNAIAWIRGFVIEARRLFSEFVDAAQTIGGALARLAGSIARAFGILAPIFDPIVERLGLVIDPIDQTASVVDRVAAAIDNLTSIIDQLAADGTLAAWAESGKQGLEQFIQKTQEVFKVIGLLTQNTDEADLQIRTENPDLRGLIIIRDAIAAIIQAINIASDVIPPFFEKFGGAIEVVIDTIGFLLEPLASLFGVQNGKQVAFLAVLAAMAAKFTLMGGLAKGLLGIIIRIGAALLGPVIAAVGIIPVAIVAAVVAIVAVIYANWDKIKEFIQSSGEQLKAFLIDKFGEVGEAIFRILKFAFNAVFEPVRLIIETLKSLFNDGFGATAERVGNYLLGLPGKLARGFFDLFASIGKLMEQAVIGALKGIASFFSAIIDKIRGVTPEQQRQRDQAGAFDPFAPSAPASTPRFAGGGQVRGRGTPTSDSILAWLSNLEFVMPYKAVAKYGLGFMESIRNGSFKLPAFATGGLVSARMPEMPSFAGMGGVSYRHPVYIPDGNGGFVGGPGVLESPITGVEAVIAALRPSNRTRPRPATSSKR